jgi:CheY-like chemotaxis protein
LRAALKTALVVDDDPLVRQLLRRMLEPATCQVVEAADGVEALRVIEAGTPPLHLLLTDLEMPGLNGLDVVEVVTTYRPDLPIVVVSSSAAQHHLELTARFGVIALAKPFTLEQVTGAVSSILADARETRARSERVRGSAERARRRSDELRNANLELRERVDLVSAAYQAHARRTRQEAEDGRRPS